MDYAVKFVGEFFNIGVHAFIKGMTWEKANTNNQSSAVDCEELSANLILTREIS